MATPVAALALSRLQDDDFVLLGLPRRWALDRAELDARWKALQREAHPDRFAAHGSAAQRVAMQWSVRLNEAHQRLKDPVRRAAYWCELQGVPVQAESNTAMPMHFLQQQMAWREALEDAADDGQALQALADEADVARAQALERLGQQIDTAADAVAAAQEVRGLMFIERFIEGLHQRLDRLED